uniref:Putative group i salivary lipocalin n=1 Tax=Rhipicephalus pulchellus TaxID=72859 RepID=L7LSU4_RHIPC
MREKHMLTILIVVGSIAILGSIKVPLKTVPSMRNFVNTTEEIWTYITSEDTKIECKADEKLYLSLISIEFQRSYYYRMKKMCYSLVGRFDPQHKEVMTIHSPGTTFKQTESIIYMDEKRSCAVVKVTMYGASQKKYDLRVRNSSVHAPPGGKCLKYFQLKAKGQEYKLYKNYCQYLLHRPHTNQFNCTEKKTPYI